MTDSHMNPYIEKSKLYTIYTDIVSFNKLFSSKRRGGLKVIYEFLRQGYLKLLKGFWNPIAPFGNL